VISVIEICVHNYHNRNKYNQLEIKLNYFVCSLKIVRFRLRGTHLFVKVPRPGDSR